jgi:hypothetical protein
LSGKNRQTDELPHYGKSNPKPAEKVQERISENHREREKRERENEIEIENKRKNERKKVFEERKRLLCFISIEYQIEKGVLPRCDIEHPPPKKRS